MLIVYILKHKNLFDNQSSKSKLFEGKGLKINSKIKTYELWKQNVLLVDQTFDEMMLVQFDVESVVQELNYAPHFLMVVVLLLSLSSNTDDFSLTLWIEFQIQIQEP